MTRHFTACALAIMLLAGPAGCSPDAANSPAGGGAKGANKPRVALVMKSLANEFFSTMARGAEEHQAQHADEYHLTVNGIKDERDLTRQVALVEEMIANEVDAIVIAPADSKALVPVLRRARQAGIVVVNIDNRLDEEVLKKEGLEIPFVGPDNRAGARKVAEYLVGRLRPGDEAAILEGIRTSFNGQQRRAGFAEALEAGGLVLVDSQSAQWEMSQANTVAAAMLGEHPRLKAILACNDSMALGAMAAVKAAGREGDVAIIGFDNISAVQQAVRDGKIVATADQHGDRLAVFGIEYALALLKDPGRPIEDRETPVDLVTAEELEQ